MRVSAYRHTNTRTRIFTVTLLLRMDLPVHGSYQFFCIFHFFSPFAVDGGDGGDGDGDGALAFRVRCV